MAQWFLSHLGLEPILVSVLTLPAIGGNTLSTSGLGRFLVFVYIWLPLPILPVQAALERLPASLLQASAPSRRASASDLSLLLFCRWRSGITRRARYLPFSPDAR